MRRIVTWSSLALVVPIWVLKGLSPAVNSPLQAAQIETAADYTPSRVDDREEACHGRGEAAHVGMSTRGPSSAMLADRPEGDRRRPS